MTGFVFRNFDLLVERSGDAYQARVLDSPGGQASAGFSLPFAAPELDDLLLRLGQAAAGVAPADAALASGFGGRLFAAAFNGDVRDCLMRSLSTGGDGVGGLRIRLRLAGVPELAVLPWELLYDATRTRFLALSNSTPLVRYLDVAGGSQRIAVQPPLSVLAMQASPPGYPPIDIDGEWDRLQAALAPLRDRGLVRVQRLAGGLSALQQQLRRGEYHVFHFTGHGGFDSASAEGLLVLSDEDGAARVTGVRALGELLADHPSLRLAMLNSCQGARSAQDDPFAGAAQGLVRAGIPAVIAMQFEIADPSAAVFAREFYSALADAYPLDAALAEARKALAAQDGEQGGSWAIPVLFMRAADGALWQIERQAGQEAPGDASGVTARRAWWAQAPAEPPAARGGDVIIADVGAGAKGVAVGKGILQYGQTFYEILGQPTPDDRQIVQQKIDQLAALVHDQQGKLAGAIGAMADFQVRLLGGELTKTGEGETPSASTITQVGDWLLKNVPQLSAALADLFQTPAAGRVMAKTGEQGIAWLRARFKA